MVVGGGGENILSVVVNTDNIVVVVNVKCSVVMLMVNR